jgi:NAD(P)-dependent dehydrogenase (short-subunit alcohol dehydrogenase family)
MPQGGWVAVTGASRGTGALVAVELAKAGYDVVVGYREKARRAESVATQVRALGRRAVVAPGDIATAAGRREFAAAIESERLAGLVLNASGGLEPGMAPDYPMVVNNEAQVALARLLLPRLVGGGRIVFVTSHYAHGYPDVRIFIPGYAPVAESKNAGERAVRAMLPELTRQDVRLVVATADILEDSTMVRILTRANPELMRHQGAGKVLPTVAEFAVTVAQGIADDTLPTGSTLSCEPTR